MMMLIIIVIALTEKVASADSALDTSAARTGNDLKFDDGSGSDSAGNGDVSDGSGRCEDKHGDDDR